MSRLVGGCCRYHSGLNPGDGIGNGFPHDGIRVFSPLLKGLERLLRGGPHRADCFYCEVPNERPVILKQRQDREQGIACRRTELGQLMQGIVSRT